MAFEKVNANPHIPHNMAIGDIDYVQDTKLVTGAMPSSIMISDESDLDELTEYTPGSIAYTAGFGEMWQLGADGTWVALGGE